MSLFKYVNWREIFKVFALVFLILIVLSSVYSSYYLGFQNGVLTGKEEYKEMLEDEIKNGKISSLVQTPKPVYVVLPTPVPAGVSTPKITWGGPDLWKAVNKARVEHGVGELRQRDELCTIASIRLNELLELGKLDGHEGFSSLPEKRPDLEWIFEKYSISEFLVSGAKSADEAVSLWLNTLGHKKLITGGEYSYGCVYAQDGFGVAIAAY